MSERMHESKFSITPGQLLAAAREARSLSQADIAKRSCLSVQSVNDLEHDEYSHIGVRTFVRGYLCTYARLVGVPETQILEALEASGLMPALPDFAPHSVDGAPVLNVTHQRSARSRYSRWVAAGVGLVLVIAVAAWLQTPKDDTVKTAEAKTKSTSTSTPVAFVQPEVVVHPEEKASPKIKTASNAASSPVSSALPAASPAPVVHTVKKVKKHSDSDNTATAELHPTYVISPVSDTATQ